MAQIKKYASNAERQAAYNERKRQAERERLEAEQRELNRKANIAQMVIRDMAELLGQKSYTHRQFPNGTLEDDLLAREIIRKIAKEIKRMNARYIVQS